MRKILYVAGILLGLALMAVGFILLPGLAGKGATVLCGAVGGGLFGLSTSALVMRRRQEKYPERAEADEIESADERNVMIRNRAKAMSADVIQWCILAVALIAFLIDAPLWFALGALAVFLLKNLLEVALMNKYQREM